MKIYTPLAIYQLEELIKQYKELIKKEKST